MRFHTLATDYDGTLVTGGRPTADVLDELARARSSGITLVLVTGRILAELDEVFPGADLSFDAIVGENGATLRLRGEPEHELAPPLSAELLQELRAAGATVRPGRVLLAAKARDAALVEETTARLGLRATAIRNREELMVLPAGVDKGTGLAAALGALGLDRGGCVAAGDAENDHALLDAAGFGVAVANAVPSLVVRAQLVLGSANGEGIRELLRGPLFRDRA